MYGAAWDRLYREGLTADEAHKQAAALVELAHGAIERAEAGAVPDGAPRVRPLTRDGLFDLPAFNIP